VRHLLPVLPLSTETGMGPSIRNWTLGLVLAAITGLHLCLRPLFLSSPEVGANEVSGLRAGTPFPALRPSNAIVSRDGKHTQLRCKMIIVFDPQCPHSSRAATRALENIRTLGFPQIWVGPTDGQVAGAPFVQLSSEVHMFWATSIFDSLKIKAVPAAFLVGGDGIILRVWPYTGEETRKELNTWCESPLERALQVSNQALDLAAPSLGSATVLHPRKVPPCLEQDRPPYGDTALLENRGRAGSGCRGNVAYPYRERMKWSAAGKGGNDFRL
jgi:hypothetical protein